MSTFVIFCIVLINVKIITSNPVGSGIVFPNNDDEHQHFFTNENEIVTSDEDDGEIESFEQDLDLDLENGDYFQGDMDLLPEQEDFLLRNITNLTVSIRTGLLNEDYRWPKNHLGKVVVSYTMSSPSKFCEI